MLLLLHLQMRAGGLGCLFFDYWMAIATAVPAYCSYSPCNIPLSPRSFGEKLDSGDSLVPVLGGLESLVVYEVRVLIISFSVGGDHIKDS